MSLLKNKLLNGTSWTGLSLLVVSVIYILRLSILTRFLSKDDFGLVAISLVVLGFTNIFADLGISTALLSKGKLSKKESSSLYWVGVLLSIVLYILLWSSSTMISEFYNSSELKGLIPIMGLDMIFSTIGRQHSVYMQKELKFKRIALIKIISEVSSLILAVFLAFYSFGVWSLVYSILIASIINSILTIVLEYKYHKIILYCNIKETKHLYGIGFFQTGAQILDYISSQLDVLILGKLLPMGDMGVYSIIKTLVNRVYSSVNQVFTKVTIPILSKLQFNPELLKTSYLTLIKLIAICNSFFYIIIILNDKFILRILYGEKFIEYGFILSLLCVWGFFSSLISCAGSIIIATGKTRIGFVWTQIRVIINPLFIILGAYYWSVEGVVLSQVFYAILTINLYYKIVVAKILDNVSFKEFIRSFYDIILFSIAITTLWLVMSHYILSSLDDILVLLISVVYVVLVYYFYYSKIVLNLIKKFK